MAGSGKFTFAKLKSFKRRGRYCDGLGLWLQVSAFGTKSWLFQYKLGGKVRQHGLGPFPDVGMAEARDRAAELRKLVRQGIDPIEQRRAKALKATKFRDFADEYVKNQKAGWRNRKHAQQWSNTLETYAYPIIGDLSVSAITKADVLRVLKPLWLDKTETADRTRSRIEKILDAAKSAGLRDGDNAAAWKAGLEHDLPARSKVRKVRHHPALPYVQIPQFMAELRNRNSISARALEFCILTAARTTAVIGAEWTEVDFDAKLWTVPATRVGTKIGDEAASRVVPLSARAVEILNALPEDGDHVFPGGKAGAPLSNAAMSELLKGMRPGVTVHGMRSAFKDWASETTNFENFISEAALWHVVADRTERAYRRGQLLQKRRDLMDSWARYCSQPPVKADAKVTSIRTGRAS